MQVVFKVEARNRVLALAGRLASGDKSKAVEPEMLSEAGDEHDRTYALHQAARQRVLRLAGLLEPPLDPQPGRGERPARPSAAAS